MLGVDLGGDGVEFIRLGPRATLFALELLSRSCLLHDVMP